MLEGSVQRDQNRVRVNVQLIDAESGAHIWADRFEADMTDLFELQDQVVAQLANALRYELGMAEAAKASNVQNPDAIDRLRAGGRSCRCRCLARTSQGQRPRRHSAQEHRQTQGCRPGYPKLTAAPGTWLSTRLLGRMLSRAGRLLRRLSKQKCLIPMILILTTL